MSYYNNPHYIAYVNGISASNPTMTNYVNNIFNRPVNSSSSSYSQPSYSQSYSYNTRASNSSYGTNTSYSQLGSSYGGNRGYSNYH
jgi:hypothetical protein